MATETTSLLPQLEQFLFTYTRNDHSISILPIIHEQVYFSQLASLALRENQVDVVAVEFPHELESPYITALQRLPICSLLHQGNLSQQGESVTVPEPSEVYIIHPGEAIHWVAAQGLKMGIPVVCIDSFQGKAIPTAQMPLDAYEVAAVGWNTFWAHASWIHQQHISSDLHQGRSVAMATQLLKLAEQYETILVVCGAAHWPTIANMLYQDGYNIQSNDPIPIAIYEQTRTKIQLPNAVPAQWKLADIHPHSIHLLTQELPVIIGNFGADPLHFDHQQAIQQIFFDAARRYQQQFNDNISMASFRRLFQYLRNLCRVKYTLTPNLLDILTAAKGMGDGDYAYEVYRNAISYPFLPNEQEKLPDEYKFSMDPNMANYIMVTFKRRFRKPVLQKIRKGIYDDLDPLPEEDFPGQWQKAWDELSERYGYVSYPPEDLYVENFFDFLRKRINELLMEENSTSMPFETSLEDGIDWRASIRHFHENKIYVKKLPRQVPPIGVLVVQFLEEPIDIHEYNYHQTLYAEHDQESHISFISTTPGETLVGPGIARIKIAAIISQFPPTGYPTLIPYGNDELKYRLLVAAMDMSLSKIIAFVAPKPPNASLRYFASSNGYRLIYLPLSQLTKETTHRLRTMHLLAHRSLRDHAREYIGF